MTSLQSGIHKHITETLASIAVLRSISNTLGALLTRTGKLFCQVYASTKTSSEGRRSRPNLPAGCGFVEALVLLSRAASGVTMRWHKDAASPNDCLVYVWLKKS